MNIAGFTLYRLTLPISGKAYTMSSGTLSEVETILLKITLDNGHEGWGETCPLGTTYAPAHARGAEAALREVLPRLIGTPATPRAAQARMDAQLAGHSYAKAAVDIALHDALARSLNVPVSTLLGGALTDRVPAYYAIGIETPENAARIGQEKLSQGFKRIQLKVGGRDPEEDIAAIRQLSDVFRQFSDVLRGTGTRLAIDANRGWTTRDAIRVSRACRDLPLVIEQPCKTMAEHRSLRPQLCHPLYLDESIVDLDNALEAAGGLADGFGLKLTRLGGLGPSAAFRDICAARNLPHTADDSWGGDIIATACTHLASTIRPDLLEGVWIAGDHIAPVPGYPTDISIVDGFIRLPQGPGLGVAPDETALGEPVEVYS